jgi:glutamate 5-kinase
MKGLVADIAQIMMRQRVVGITSGAVESGRAALGIRRPRKELNDMEKRQCAMVGQHRLMVGWDSLLTPHGLMPGQMLVTHALVEDDKSTANDVLAGILEAWKNPRILPIINENDAVSSEEIREMDRGGDNDKNAFLIARLVGASVLAIMTTSDGVYAKADRPETRQPILHARNLSDDVIAQMCKDGKHNGSGGMTSKLAVARDFVLDGGKAYIFNGTNSSLSDLFEYDNPEDLPGGTVIVA